MSRRILIAIIILGFVVASACSSKDSKDEAERHGPAKIDKRRSGERGSPERRAQRLQKRLDLSAEQVERVEAALRDNPRPGSAQAAVKAILDPAQLSKYEAMLSGRARAVRAGRGRNPAARAAQLQSELGLSDDQKRKLEAVFTARRSRSEQREELQGILTDEQFAAYEKVGARRDGRRFRRRGFVAPALRAAWLSKELGLDREQRDKIVALYKTPQTHGERSAAMNKILRAAQFVEYADIRANRSELRPEHGYKAPVERAAWLHKELGLDDGQRDKLAEMFKVARSREEVAERLGRILTREELTSYDELLARRPRGREALPATPPAVPR